MTRSVTAMAYHKRQTFRERFTGHIRERQNASNKYVPDDDFESASLTILPQRKASTQSHQSVKVVPSELAANRQCIPPAVKKARQLDPKLREILYETPSANTLLYQPKAAKTYPLLKKE